MIDRALRQCSYCNHMVTENGLRGHKKRCRRATQEERDQWAATGFWPPKKAGRYCPFGVVKKSRSPKSGIGMMKIAGS